MSDLLPCPFCGSSNLRYELASSQGYICCDECGTMGPCDEQAADPHCDIEAAEVAWNRRPAQPEAPAWRTMESAPKDGSMILGRAGEDCAVVCWEIEGIGGYWNLAVCGSFAADGEWTPEAWTPIPGAGS